MDDNRTHILTQSERVINEGDLLWARNGKMTVGNLWPRQVTFQHSPTLCLYSMSWTLWTFKREIYLPIRWPRSLLCEPLQLSCFTQKSQTEPEEEQAIFGKMSCPSVPVDVCQVVLSMLFMSCEQQRANLGPSARVHSYWALLYRITQLNTFRHISNSLGPWIQRHFWSLFYFLPLSLLRTICSLSLIKALT